MKNELIKLEELKEALSRLNEGLKESESQLEKDGVLQRFEFTFELSWKVIQEYAKVQGLEVVSPREAIRVGAALEIIADPEGWFVDLKNRNLTTHIYDAETAAKIYQQVSPFVARVDDLIKKIEVGL